MIPHDPYDPSDPTHGHRGYVRQVRYLGLTGLAATVGYDGSARLSRVPDLAPVDAAYAHPGGAGALDALDDGRLVTAGADGWVRFWRTDDGQLSLYAEVQMPELDEDPLIETAAWLADGSAALVGVVGGSIWEVDPISSTTTFVDQESLISINAFALSEDGTVLWLASDESTVRRYLRDSRRWVHETTSAPFDDHVDGLAYDEDSGTLLAVTHGRALWRADDPRGALAFVHAPVADNALNAVIWCGDEAVVGGDDHFVRAVDPHTFEQRVIGEVNRDVDGLALAGEHVLAATTGGLVALHPDRGVVAQQQHCGAIGAIATDGDLILVGLHDAPLIIVGRFAQGSGVELGRIRATAPVSCSAGTAPWFGLADGSVVEVDPRLLTVTRTVSATAEVEGLAIGEVGGINTVVATDRGGNATVIRGEDVVTIPVTDSARRLKAARFVTLGGRTLVLCAGKDHQLHGFDPVAPEAGAWTLADSDVAMRTFNDITVIGDVVYGANWDRRIHRLRLADAHRVAEVLPALEGHDHAVERLTLSEGLLCSVSYDGHLRTWHLDGTPHQATRLGRMAVRRLVESPHPGRVIAAGYGGRLIELDPHTHTITGHWTVA